MGQLKYSHETFLEPTHGDPDCFHYRITSGGVRTIRIGSLASYGTEHPYEIRQKKKSSALELPANVMSGISKAKLSMPYRNRPLLGKYINGELKVGGASCDQASG